VTAPTGFLLEQADETDDFDGVDGIAGTVSWAPAGTDPLEAAGWTEIGYTTDGVSFGADADEHRAGLTNITRTLSFEVPKVSREAIALAMGVDVRMPFGREPWPPEPDPITDSIAAAFGVPHDVLGIPVMTSQLLPPGQVIIGAHGLGPRMWPLDENRTDHFLTGPVASAGTHDGGGSFDVGMWAYLAAERIALSIPRTYGFTATSVMPSIGWPPRKGRGLTGRRYRIARRAYARQRRAWIRQGSPTYATAIHMPSVILSGVDIA